MSWYCTWYLSWYCTGTYDDVTGGSLGVCLHRFADFEQDLWGLYNLEHSDQLGKSSGWPSLDEFYRVSPLSLSAPLFNACHAHVQPC